MGVTISSKRHFVDMGYFGFNRFRNRVAERVGPEVLEHYQDLDNQISGSKEFFEAHDRKTQQLIDEGKLPIEIASFLYQSDCGGKIDRKQAKMIYELIQNDNDSEIFGYCGRVDKGTMGDLKKIFSDKTQIKWY